VTLSIFVGDLCDVPAEALCTSTNPRLSLAMGTGGSVRSRGGFTILRACEAIVKAASGPLLPGSAHLTAAGDLPAKAIIHCVASNARHQSSPEIVRSCVANALLRAGEAGCTSVAFPVFGTGHARLPFDQALRVIIQELKTADLDHAWIVINDSERIETVLRVIGEVVPDAVPSVLVSPQVTAGEGSMWFADE
jgi:O-acetyl-ADP-ribose deacetylase (regulator of RNase III)